MWCYTDNIIKIKHEMLNNKVLGFFSWPPWTFFLLYSIKYNNGEHNIVKSSQPFNFTSKLLRGMIWNKEKQFSIMHHLNLGHMIKVIPNSVHIF